MEQKLPHRRRLGVGVFPPPLLSGTGGTGMSHLLAGTGAVLGGLSPSGLAAFLGVMLLCSSPIRGESIDRISLIVTGLAGMPEYGANFRRMGDPHGGSV